MAGATCYLIKDTFLFPLFEGKPIGIWNLVIVVATFLVLNTNKIPAPFIVLGCLVLGWLVRLA